MYNLLAEHAPKIDRDQSTTDPRPYALGYTEGEFKRLELQGALIHDLTEHVLRSAGIGPGMRVLDIGCGVGDVSLLAGKLVGPTGRVLGVDRSAEAVDIAERRATESGQCYWTRFTVGELDKFSPDETFDAVIGRLVLMYLPDPAATLRRLAGFVRPGGLIAFQEWRCRSPAVFQRRRCSANAAAGSSRRSSGRVSRSTWVAGCPWSSPAQGCLRRS